MSARPRSASARLQRYLARHRKVTGVALAIKFRRPVGLTDRFESRMLQVPYPRTIADLEMDGFVLGLDGPAHVVEADRISKVLADSAVGHEAGLAAAAAVVAHFVSSGASELSNEVTFDLANMTREAIVAWASELLGVDGGPAPAGGPDLLTAAQAIVDRTYTNPVFPGCPYRHEKGDSDRETLERFRQWLSAQDPPPGSVHHLLRTRSAATANRDMVGLIGGPVTLTIAAAYEIVVWALDDRANWAALHQGAKSSLPEFEAALRRAIRLAPPAPMVPRLIATVEGARVKRIMVPLWDKRNRKHPDRNEVFGVAPHLCLGEAHAMAVLRVVLRPLFLRSRATWTGLFSSEIRLGPPDVDGQAPS